MSTNGSVRVTTLDNGLRIATDSMPGVESAAIGVWAAVGTRSEPRPVNGVAHMLEHMAFKGTERRTARDIAEEIEAVGGHINAYTSRESTAYYARLLADDVPLAVDILADILQNSIFDAGRAGARARRRAAGDRPGRGHARRHHLRPLPGDRLSRPADGPARCWARSRRWARCRARPSWATCASTIPASGWCWPPPAASTTTGWSSWRARPSHATQRGNGAAAEPARYQGGGFRELRELEQVHVVLGFEGFGFRDPDYYAASVSRRCWAAACPRACSRRSARSAAWSTASTASARSYSDGGLFGIYAGTGEDEVEKLIPLVCDELLKVADKPSAAEVDRARAQLRAGILMAQESTSARCEQLANQLLVWGRPLGRDEIMARVEAVGEADVVRVAQRLIAEPPTLAALGPIERVEALETMAARLR